MSNWLKKYWWVVLCVIGALLAPIFLNFAFKNWHISTGPELNNTHWLGFWGGYLGGILGSVAALIALLVTIRQQEKHHIDAEEANRHMTMPAVVGSFIPVDENTLSCIAIDSSTNCHPFTASSREPLNRYVNEHTHEISCYFKIENIGLGPAFEVRLFVKSDAADPANLGGFSAGQSQTFLLLLAVKHPYSFILRFKDVSGNVYESETQITDYNDDNTCTCLPATSPKLISRAKPQ